MQWVPTFSPASSSLPLSSSPSLLCSPPHELCVKQLDYFTRDLDFLSLFSLVVLVALVYCTIWTYSFSQAYALSRDHGLPLASVWRQVNSWGVPFYAILLAAIIAILLNIPLLAGNAAYYAVTGTATTAWFTAYAVPIGFRLTSSANTFVPGPFSLADYVGATGR